MAAKRQAGLRRRAVQDVLEVQREQEELRESDRGDGAGDHIRGRERVAAERVEWQQGRRGSPLDRDERDGEQSGRDERRHRRGAAPAFPGRVRERVDEHHQRGCDRRGTGEVELASDARRPALGKVSGDEQDER